MTKFTLWNWASNFSADISIKTLDIMTNPEKLKLFNNISTVTDISILVLSVLIWAYFLKQSASKNELEIGYWKSLIWVIWSVFIASFWFLIPNALNLPIIVSIIIFFVLFFYILYFSLKWHFKIEPKKANKIATRTTGFFILFSIIFWFWKMFLLNFLIQTI